MNTKNILIVKMVLLLCISAFGGCTKDTIQLPSPYDGCCGTALKIYEIEDYKVYIPNVITPNYDGINDVFYPICNVMNPDSFGVIRYYIYDDTSNYIFVREGLDIEEAEAWGFKGIAWTKPFKLQLTTTYEYTGKFKYTFIMAFRLKDGSIHLEEVAGDACVVRCDDDAHVIRNKEGCYFPVQGFDGIYNPTRSINEDECIK